MKTQSVLTSRMKLRRKALKIGQEELAQLVGVARQTISSWEGGVFLPRQDSLVEIAKALQTTKAYLLGESDDPGPQEIPGDPEPQPIKVKAFKSSRPATVEDFARLREASRNLDSLGERDLTAAYEMLLASLEEIEKEQALRAAKSDGAATSAS